MQAADFASGDFGDKLMQGRTIVLRRAPEIVIHVQRLKMLFEGDVVVRLAAMVQQEIVYRARDGAELLK